MIDGLIAGKLYGKPARRTGNSGKAFVVAKVRTAVRTAAGDGEPLFVNVIAFSEAAGDALLALDDGDSIALSGALTPKVWTDKSGTAKPALDMVAHTITTPYHIQRKRRAMQPGQAPANEDGINDDIDF